jgi:hypothetical protein
MDVLFRAPLKLTDFVDQIFILGSKNFLSIKRSLTNLDFTTNINFFVQNNENFIQQLKNFDFKKNILILNSDYFVDDELIYKNLNFVVAPNINKFDIIFWSGEYENLKLIEGLGSYWDKLNTFKNNINDINIYKLNEDVIIKNWHAVVISNEFLKNLPNNIKSIEELLFLSKNNYIVQPNLLKKNLIKITKSPNFSVVLNFKQGDHLGDNLFTLIYLNKLVEKFNHIYINFYINSSNISQINKLKTNNNIQIFDINESSEDIPYLGLGFDLKLFEDANYVDKDLLYFRLLNYEKFSKFLNVPKLFYNIDDVLYSNKNIKFDESANYTHILINSRSMSYTFSNSYNLINEQFIKIADFLYNKGIKFITTEKIKDYPCTRELYPNLIDIYKITPNLKVIVAIDTAPLNIVITKENYKNLKQFLHLNQNIFNYKRSIPISQNIRQIKEFEQINLNSLV